ncbi:MAG: tetratricopeptide repeat protein [Pseudomonadota bacterium]
MAARSIDIRLGLALVFLFGGSACTNITPYETPSEPGIVTVPELAPPRDASGTGEPDPADVPSAPPVAAKPGPAAAHLVQQAQRLSARRDFAAAAAQLERALRIERDNPWIYLALADVRLAQGDAEQAAALTRRARGLSRGDPEVLSQADALALRDPRPGGR